MGNDEKTHFIINVGNGKKPTFTGCNNVKYAKVVSGGDGFTMMVIISGGRNARIEPRFPFLRTKTETMQSAGCQTLWIPSLNALARKDGWTRILCCGG